MAFRNRLRRLSRDGRAVWAIAAVFPVLGFLVAITVNLIAPPPPPSLFMGAAEAMIGSEWSGFVQRAIADTRYQDDEVVEVFEVPWILVPDMADPAMEDRIVSASSSRPGLAPWLVERWRLAYADAGGSGKALARLTQACEAEQPPRWVNRLLADHWIAVEKPGKAGPLAEREWLLFGDEEAWYRAYEAYSLAGNKEAVDRLQATPPGTSNDYRHLEVEQAYQERDWATFVRAWFRANLWEIPPGVAFLGWVSAGIWIVVLLAVHELPLTVRSLGWVAAGVAFGGASVLPVDLWLRVQAELGIVESMGYPEGFVHSILGIGLREELCKLVLFLPLLPFLTAAKNRSLCLLVAGSVGLGFALVENLSYFQRGGTDVSVGRFLTANLLHVSMTATIGIAACRAWVNPKRHLLDFALQFWMVVAIHGLYDAFLMMPILAEGSWVALLFFLGMLYLYFHEVERYRAGTEWLISSAAFFVWGLALLVAVNLPFLAREVGSFQALGHVTRPLLELAFAIILFLRLVPHQLQWDD